VRRVLSIKGFKIFVLDVKVEKEFVRAFYRRLGFKEVRLIIMRVVRASTNNTILEMG
jgi:ribosomal protein S18 acetylase RimI-like enzyme